MLKIFDLSPNFPVVMKIVMQSSPSTCTIYLIENSKYCVSSSHYLSDKIVTVRDKLYFVTQCLKRCFSEYLYPKCESRAKYIQHRITKRLISMKTFSPRSLFIYRCDRWGKLYVHIFYWNLWFACHDDQINVTLQ